MDVQSGPGRKPVRERNVLAAVLALVGLLWGIRPLFPIGSLDSSPILWSGYEGVFTSSDGGKTRQEFTLTDRKGTRIFSPVFVFWRDSLVYWSENDQAVCRVSSSGKRQWVPVADKAMAATWCHRLEATPEGVILNGGTLDTPVSPIRINLTTGAASAIRGVLEAQSDESSGKTALLTKGGSIEVLTGRNRKVLARPNQVLGQWDYDPKEDVVCFSDGSKITVVSSYTRTSWRINRLVTVWSVSLRPDARQVWVSVERPFSLGAYLIVYSYDGTFLGRTLDYEGPIGPPIQTVRAEDIELLMRASSH